MQTARVRGVVLKLAHFALQAQAAEKIGAVRSANKIYAKVLQETITDLYSIHAALKEKDDEK